jgi:outer membrane protein OmpA-like peptidoglycan-associated protein
VRRPTGYTQSQTRDGYYYIDDISVTPNATPQNCKCEPGNFAFANLNKAESTFETAEKDVPKPVIIGTTGNADNAVKENKPAHKDVIVGFPLGKSDLSAKEIPAIDESIEFLKNNPKVKVELIGHMDNDEKVVKGLGTDRIEQVAKYLISKGIEENRITKKDVNTTKPLDTSGLKENREKNMVVEMKFLN